MPQSLALVTAKEPLRIAVANNLRTLLTNQLDANTLEQVVAMLVADNLDLCCQVQGCTALWAVPAMSQAAPGTASHPI